MRPTTPATLLPPRTPGPPPSIPNVWPEGIFNKGNAPFPSEMYMHGNTWQGERDGVHVVVYAGAAGEQPEPGLVIVQTKAADLQTVQAQWYVTPEKAGGVRVVEAHGDRLALASKEDRTFVFDVGRRQFVAP
jgi:hypothetical protein